MDAARHNAASGRRERPFSDQQDLIQQMDSDRRIQRLIRLKNPRGEGGLKGAAEFTINPIPRPRDQWRQQRTEMPGRRNRQATSLIAMTGRMMFVMDGPVMCAIAGSSLRVVTLSVMVMMDWRIARQALGRR